MKDRERFLKLCVHGMETRGVMGDERFKNRLKKEIKEVDAQGEHEYYLGLHDKFRAENLKFPENQHNNLIDYLLGLTEQFDIEESSAYVQGEFPDIDTDYLKAVRDYLKRVWAPKTFGQEFVCEIGTYGTSGIKSAALDMARVHGADKDSLQAITTTMADKYADDEGNAKDLEWEDALRIYPEFSAYCEQNPQVADAARMLLDRIRSGGVHAGGLIIADRRLDGFVPLEVRMVNKDNPNGVVCAAWTEGLNRQDLSPVGLIKFDLLVIANLLQIALGVNLVKQRHGIESISAQPGLWDFSDLAYLNDPKALAMADKGDLKGIFQYDSEGMRKLVKRGGVTSFDDLAAYSAIYRPGPLNMGMDVTYCRRKKGEEPYNIHPVMQQALGTTYGVMVYQEQVQEILRAVGKIPDMHTEKVRKAISKKKVKDFIKYKEQFIENGQVVLGVNADFVNNLWDQIQAFAEYGFNKSVLNTTEVVTRRQDGTYGVKKIEEFVAGEIVLCVDEDGNTVETQVVALHDHGMLEGYEVTFDDGHTVTCTADHKFLTEKGQVPLREICEAQLSIWCAQQDGGFYAKEGKGVDVSVWDRLPNAVEAGRTPTGLRGVSKAGLEEVGGDACGSMRGGVRNDSEAGCPPSGMQRLRCDQEGEHSASHGEVECRQLASRSKEDLFRDGSEDFGSTRGSGRTSVATQEVAGGEPGEACGLHGSGVEEPQAISDGSVAAGAVDLAVRENSMRRHAEAGGFSQRQDLDRGGRLLPFLRAPQQRAEPVPAADGASEGCDAQRRGIASCRCDADSVEHGMFSFVDGRDEAGGLGLAAGHAPIADTRRLVRRRVVRVVPVGKRQMYDLEVAASTHNYLLANGVVTSNSHAYAYTYVSSRLLYLKAHYPIEFYTATLMCESDADKMKEYKLDASKHGVEVCGVDINLSKRNFSIQGDKIYFGFSNIKGLGDDVADQIVAGQPYKNLPDFLERFGNDDKAVKRLIALGVFKDGHDRVTLRKFSEWHKRHVKGRRDRQKRFVLSVEGRSVELRDLLLQEVPADDPQFEAMNQFTPEADALWKERFKDVIRQVPYNYKGEARIKDVPFIKILQDVAKKRQASIDNNRMKEEADEQLELSVSRFDASSETLDDEEMVLLTDELVVNGNTSYPMAESLYYGFQWTHILETSPDYTGATLDRFMEEAERGLILGHVEVQISGVRERTSKKGTAFYSVDIEDANGKRMTCNVWQDDYDRFKEYLVAGNLVSMQVNPPGGGFNTLTFKSVPRHERRKLPPKEQDARMVILRKPEPVEPERPVRGPALPDLDYDSSAIQIID